MAKETKDGFREEYSFLSNFTDLEKPIIDGFGIKYWTVEHLYQAMKTSNEGKRRNIAEHPKKGLKKYVKNMIIAKADMESFHKNKLEIMEKALRFKFAKGTKYHEMLMNTGDVELVEYNYWNDIFWGVCNNQGDNHLGKILMKIRAESSITIPTEQPTLDFSDDNELKTIYPDTVKIIVAGSREVEINHANLMNVINVITQIMYQKSVDINIILLSGMAKGADQIPFAVKEMFPSIIVEEYPADWVNEGKSAGYKRNIVMADNADILIAVWNGESKGTQHMIDIMNKRGKPVHVVAMDNECPF